MFTTGSKFFLGASAVALVSTVVYGITQGGDNTKLGTITLIGGLVAVAFLAGINFFTRDGNQSSMEQGIAETGSAAARPARNSIWPLVAVLGLGLVVVGAETRPWVFIIGIAAVLAAAVEWVVTAWADRATASTQFNADLRKRVLGPLEFPMLAAAGLGAAAYSFSRIMLWIDKGGGPLVFGLLAAGVLAGGAIIASRPSLRKGLVTGIAGILGLGLISTGAVMAIDGQRTIEKHPTTASEPAVCDEAEADAHVDKRAPGDIGMISSPAAIVVARDGKLAVFSQGLRGARSDVTLTAGTVNNIIFRNYDAEPRRFTMNLGKFVDNSSDPPAITTPKSCTTTIEQGKEALLTVRFTKPSSVSQEPYTITSPGLEGQAIEVIVP